MIEITIRPHAHIVDMLSDRYDATEPSPGYDTWLGCELPAAAAARLRRYQELATPRILEAIDGAVVQWTSEQVDESGGVQEVEMTPEDEEVRQRVEHILRQTLLEVCEWEPDWRCQCGEVTGEYCYWTGPRSETVVVEWLPEYLRASALAAGGWAGGYPASGAVRIRVSRDCAEAILETEGEWAYVVEEGIE